MKHLFLSFIVITSCIESIAQKDFEGIIDYKIMQPERNSSISDTMSIYFAPGRVLIMSRVLSRSRDMLIDLDSGKVYRLINDDKTYTFTDLAKTFPIPDRPSTSILGYNVRSVKWRSPWGEAFVSGASLYVSDDLVYHIPPKYQHNPELMMVYDNRIILDGILFMESGEYTNINEDRGNNDAGPRLEAIKVTPQPVARYISDMFSSYTFNDEPDIVMDSTTMAVDTMAMQELPPPPPPSVPKPPVKKPVNKKPVSTKPPIKKEQ